MNSQSISTIFTPCVACLSPGRVLNFIDDIESKRTFAGFLNQVELSNYPIPLCNECTGRLRSATNFRMQVQQGHKLLKEFTDPTRPPTSMSTLSVTRVETFEYMPNSTHNSQIANTLQTDTSQNDTLQTDTSQNDTLQTDTLQNNTLQTDTLQTDTSQNDTLQTDTSPEKKPRINQCDMANNFDLDKQTDDNNTATNPETFLHSSQIKIENESNNLQDQDIKPVNLQCDNWEVKEETTQETENPLECIKKEPVDEKEYESLDKDNSKINDESVDSDNEPLKPKRMRTKKDTKEVKVQKCQRPVGVVSEEWVEKKLQQLNVPPGQLELVVLSWEEVEIERQKSLANKKYTRHQFRCASCIVGFNHQFKLDLHMKKHLPDAGDLECNICKTRFKSQSLLSCHRNRHRTRWRCVQCKAMFSHADTAADHHARSHGTTPTTHACHVCGFEATSLSKLRVHLNKHADRQHCKQCGKSFMDKNSLRTHLYIHTNQKDFSCDVCDEKFRSKKALEIHRITHQAAELLYCRDCDMNFKSKKSFDNHINYSMKHIHPDKIKYACEFCPRRFSQPAQLQEHRHTIHLKLAPHRCTIEGCAFCNTT